MLCLFGCLRLLCCRILLADGRRETPGALRILAIIKARFVLIFHCLMLIFILTFVKFEIKIFVDFVSSAIIYVSVIEI